MEKLFLTWQSFCKDRIFQVGTCWGAGGEHFQNQSFPSHYDGLFWDLGSGHQLLRQERQPEREEQRLSWGRRV